MPKPGVDSIKTILYGLARANAIRLFDATGGSAVVERDRIGPESSGRVRIGRALMTGALLLAVACSRPAPQPAAEERPGGEPLPEPAIVWQPRTYVAPRTPEPPVIDGRLDEPAWRAAAWTEDFTDIEGPSRPAPKFRTRARMLWDSTNLYVGAEIEEPDVWATLTEHDSVIYHDNDFEVFIDPDGDTHEYYELEINALGTVWDLFLVKPYRDGGPAVNAWEIRGLRSAVTVNGTINRPGDRDAGWSVELAIPWDVLKEAAHRDAPPAPGDQWRINFSRVEWRTEARDGRYEKVLDSKTGKPLPENNWVWSPQGLVAMHYPEMWGIVQFSERATDTFQPGGDDLVKWLLRVVYYRERNWFAKNGSYTTDLAQLGLASAPAPGGPWPPAVAVTPHGFEASLAAPKGHRLVITQDGAVR